MAIRRYRVRLEPRFAGPVENAEALAQRLIEFCPDIADQAEQVRAIADGMTRTGWFAFWWD